MSLAFHAGLGQVVLIEWLDDPDVTPVTGLVVGADAGTICIDLIGDVAPEWSGAQVVLSVFAAEAMYRAHGTMWLSEDRLAELRDIVADEPVQRRSWPRRRLSLPVSLVSVDATVPVSVLGKTTDIGVGGTRVVTGTAIEAGQDPLVAITMPEGDVLLMPSRVVRAETDPEGYCYGLVFPSIDGDEAARLARLVGVECA
jgi:hypothetical protein